jgi:phosphoenolpyruvate carboxylase
MLPLKELNRQHSDYDNKRIVASLQRNTVVAIFAEHSTHIKRRTIIV